MIYLRNIMPDGICLKGQIRGQPPPKKWCFLGGGWPPHRFSKLLDQFSWKFFWDNFNTFLVQKKIFGPRRIFYAPIMDLKLQFFCRISDFGRKSAKICRFSNFFEVKIRFSGITPTKIIFFTSTNVKFTLILFLMIFFRTNIAF